MAEPQLGLKLAFYAYPCLLFLTLLGGQSIQYYYSRRKGSEPSASDAQKQKAATTRRIYEKTIWALQLILSLLLLASTVLAVLEAVTAQHEATGHIRFPFSAYLVCALSSMLKARVGVFTDWWCRHPTLEFSSISLPAYSLIRKGHGLQAHRIVARG